MALSIFSLRKPWLFPLRVFLHTYMHCLHHHVFTRASALTYTTLLAVIPTLILIHSMAGAFGILNLAVDVLPKLNAELQLGLPITNLRPILLHVQTIGFGQLGIIGSLSLLVTFVLAMENLETNMNVVWHVKESRSYFHKTLVAVPFLILIGVLFGGITGFLSYLQHWLVDLNQYGFITIQSWYWHWLSSWVLFMVAHFVLWLCLFLMYKLVPHTHVNPWIALLSALVTVVGIRILIWGFIEMQTYFFQRMSLFYGSLAFIPLVMLLLYCLWCVVLYGNALCWRLQNWPPRRGSNQLKDNL